MRLSGYMIASAAALAMTAVSCSGSKGSHEVPVVDLAANVDLPEVAEAVYGDVEYVPLDTATAALMSDRAEVAAVIGDTIVIHDMQMMGDDSRLLLFSLFDGRFIREIKHCGQGPGEYSWIEAVFPDRGCREIVIKGANYAVSRYTLSDSLVMTKKVDVLKNRQFPAGSIAHGINVAEPYDGDLRIHQFDGDFNVVDTLVVPDYDPMYISMRICTSDGVAMFNVVDTLYALSPGRMEPVAILSCGNKSMTPELEKEVYLNMKDPQQSNDARARYIQFGNFWKDGDNLLLIYYYNNHTYIDLYSLADGSLLNRRVFSYEDEDPGWIIPWRDNRFHINLPLMADGRFYAIVGDSEAVDADGNQNPDGNVGIVSFRITKP